MAFLSALPLALLLVALLGQQAGARAGLSGRCPPKGFRALPASKFNITEYIAAPWYAQRQEPLVYQPRYHLYCVRAVYEPLQVDNPLAGLRVINTANEGSVSGPPLGTSGRPGGPQLIARVPNPRRPSKLLVGLTLGGERQLSSGAYWIVAAGQSGDATQRSGNAYDWAIISGGAPRTPRNGRCATGSRYPKVRRVQTDNVGLWLLSRLPVDPINTQVMLAKLEELGLDASRLLPVTQAGCQYPASG